MTYIIDPRWFYWVNTLETLKTVLYVLTCFSCMVTVGATINATITLAENARYGPDDKDYQQAIRTLKIVKKVAFVLIILILACTFIPGKTTLIEMQVAKMATVENAEWTVESLKQVVDYIVESMAKLK